jgi:hypothetical protein
VGRGRSRPAPAGASTKFENTKGGNRDCRPFGSLTGGRGDRVLIDDPHSVKTAESTSGARGHGEAFREGATDRLNDIARQRHDRHHAAGAQKDVAGTILELGGFTHLNLPMEFEPERKCATVLRPANDGNPAVLFEDPRTKAGELLFPERFPPLQLARLKKAKGAYAWAGQYQQRRARRRATSGGTEATTRRAWP